MFSKQIPPILFLFLFFSSSSLVLSCSKKEKTPKVEEAVTANQTPPPETVVVPDMNSPESVDYDPKTKTFFISNYRSGRIYKQQGEQLNVFVEGYTSFMGVKVHNEILYVAEDLSGSSDKIRGFEIGTGAEKFLLRIPNTGQLNDVEIIGEDLYVTDRQENKIYKINISTKDYTVIDDTIITPNGLWHDATNNRLLVCNTIADSSIYAIDLATNELSTVVTSTFSHFDGIAMDTKGNIYISSWSLNWEASNLIRYDGASFTSLLGNTDGMADISFNAVLNQIDIANFYKNTITHYKIR